MTSKYFGSEKPEFPHLEEADRVGRDIRRDVEDAFVALQADLGDFINGAAGDERKILVFDDAGVPKKVDTTTAAGDVTITNKNGKMEIGADKVVTAKILNGSVTAAKVTGLASNQIIIGADGTAANNATGVLAGGASDVTATQLAGNVVITINNDAVTAAKIPNGSVTAAKVDTLASKEVIMGTAGGNVKVTLAAAGSDISLTEAGVATVNNSGLGLLVPKVAVGVFDFSWPGAGGTVVGTNYTLRSVDAAGGAALVLPENAMILNTSMRTAVALTEKNVGDKPQVALHTFGKVAPFDILPPTDFDNASFTLGACTHLVTSTITAGVGAANNVLLDVICVDATDAILLGKIYVYLTYVVA